MKTCMFPGQGSQAVGMGGAELFDTFSAEVAQADAILGYSIRELCLEDPRKELDDTRFTQPALFVVNALSYLQRQRQGAPPPDFLAGHSLGEFNALHAAGCFDFLTGVQLVSKRGELMSRATGGAMAAVINSTPESVEAALRENGLSNVHLANFNTPVQIVVSGAREEVAAAQSLLQKGKVLFFPLKTSGAFHTPFMNEAQVEFRSFLETCDFFESRIPVISNVTARPYERNALVDTLSKQIASPVRWSDSIGYLLSLEVDGVSMEFEEVGHGDVLTKMIRANRQGRSPAPRAASAAMTAPAAPEPTEVQPQIVHNDAPGKVAAWNRVHPVGTQVSSAQTSKEPLRTRTEAVVLFGHRAAVYLEGYEGYFDLDEIAVV
jgi:malonyl CoA-acyl carrier protein transacylase